MSGKLLHSFSDENPDLQKQIGCMNGIFQLFDRRHGFGTRRIASHSQKRLPPGQTSLQATEHSIALPECSEIHLKKVIKEKQRTPTESSRTSCSSSSCSSTFSSIDSNRGAQTEIPSTRSDSPRNPTNAWPKNQKGKPSFSSDRISPDFCDAVKDSIYREAHGLSVRTASKEATAGHGRKHIDSPRPSLNKPGKLRLPNSNEAPGVCDSPRGLKGEKDSPRLLTPKDCPRFSYDGRETREKSVIKLKELPRLSLDSKQASPRNFTTELKPKCASGNLRRGFEECPTNPQQEPGSNKRPSSLVAKLMGLEDVPDIPINDRELEPLRACTVEDSQTSISSHTREACHRERVAHSRNFTQESASPQLQISCSTTRPYPSSTFPMETAAMRQQDAKPRSLELSPLTVYGEIEKRLTELQFRKSGKDLRALKQILEAMQKNKDAMEAKKDEPHAPPQTVKLNQISNTADQSIKLDPKGEQPIPAKIKGSTSPKKTTIVKQKKNAAKVDSPSPTAKVAGETAVIRKGLAGLKHAAKTRIPRNVSQDPSSRSCHPMDKDTSIVTLRSIKISKEPQHFKREKCNSSRSSGALSPRLPPKKVGMEKRSHPIATSLEARKSRGATNMQQQRPGSSGRKLCPKSSYLQHDISEVSSESRSQVQQCLMNSLQSNTTPHTMSEPGCADQPKYIMRTFEQDSQNHAITDLVLKGDITVVLPAAMQEQPSPVSVLDAMFYGDDSPSPVKKIANAFQDDGTMSFGEPWNISEHDCSTQSSAPYLSLTSHHKTPELTDHETQKHRNPYYGDEPPVNCITQSGMKIYLGRDYIYEILSASSLLDRELASNIRAMQPHPSGHMINPNLFLALEGNKQYFKHPADGDYSRIAQMKLNDKMNRKLVFDTVDEILLGISALGGSETWPSRRKLTKKNSCSQKLLAEVCSEIDRLQSYSLDTSFDQEDEDLKGIMWEEPAYQIDINNEIKGIVLEVERSIFKDLIVEIVKGEAVTQNARVGGPFRRLFHE